MNFIFYLSIKERVEILYDLPLQGDFDDARSKKNLPSSNYSASGINISQYPVDDLSLYYLKNTNESWILTARNWSLR